MARTVAELSDEERKTYRLSARVRTRRSDQAMKKREKQAWMLARQAADLLRKRYGARRVMVFGSLAHKDCFTLWSDVDLAVWGLHPEDTFKAMGAVQDLDADIEINLVDVSTGSPSLIHEIESEGIEI